MTDRQLIKRRMVDILEKHRGRSNAIRRKVLFEKLIPDAGFSIHTMDRPLRELKRELIADGIPVLFCTSNPGGYYLPSNHQELNDGINKTRAYLIEEARTLRDLKTMVSHWIIPTSASYILESP